MKSGLTLIEMLVVLTILALLASVAVTSTEGLVEQARYDSAQRGLGNIEDAILGPHGQRTPDGAPWVTGFVADIGRLPEVVGAPEDVSRHLQELWTATPLPPFAIQTTPADLDVRIAAGWRGPYLRLPIGTDSLLDPWGYPYELLSHDNDSLEAGDGVAEIQTLGAKHEGGGTGYETDLELVIHRTEPPLHFRHLGAVPVRVTGAEESGSGVVFVRIYGPENGIVRALDQKQLSASFVDTFPDITIGPRAVRAYQAAALPNKDDPVTATRKSRIVSCMVIQGGVPEIVLDLEVVPPEPEPTP